MTSRPVSVTSPITAARTSHLAHTARNSSTRPGSTTAIIRSCDSLIKISGGPSDASRSGTSSRLTSMPPVPAAASSVVAQATPAAPRSWMPTVRPPAKSSRQHSTSSFSVNGSPTCTLGRFAESTVAPPNVALASTDAPPTPSGPVVDPNKITLLPAPLAAATCRSRCPMIPTQSALTSGFPA